MHITLWHNPRCSKSRAALKILQDQGLEPEIRRYLEDAPSAQELESLLAQLQCPAQDLIRRGEKEFKELGLDAAGTSESRLIAAMVEHPRLIERPVVITAHGAVIGRPPEKILEVLS